jgi:hypothetical protein
MPALYLRKVIHPRSTTTTASQGTGNDRANCMRQFNGASDRFSARPFGRFHR